MQHKIKATSPLHAKVIQKEKRSWVHGIRVYREWPHGVDVGLPKSWARGWTVGSAHNGKGSDCGVTQAGTDPGSVPTRHVIFSFLTCKMGIIIVTTSLVCYKY